MAAADAACDTPFDPFSAGESACEAAIEALVTEGGRELYEKYIHRRSFPYASNVAVEILSSELQMCYMQVDSGPSSSVQVATTVSESGSLLRSLTLHVPEALASVNRTCSIKSNSQDGLSDGDDDWVQEPEPPRCGVDSWARACVPIRRRVKKAEEATTPSNRKASLRLSVNNSVSSPQNSRPSSRQGLVAGTDHRGTRGSTGQVVALAAERSDDEEEQALREMKEREARRNREEERKMAEEAQQAARSVQVSDQISSKTYTYDSAGNILWVTPPALNKLPNHVSAMGFTCQKETFADNSHVVVPHPPPVNAKRNVARKVPKGKPNVEFPDGFKKLSSQQPSMMEAMSMSAGVELQERGQQKHGGDAPGGEGLSRREYEAMVSRDANPVPMEAGMLPEDINKKSRSGGMAPAALAAGVSAGGAAADSIAAGNAAGAAEVAANGGEEAAGAAAEATARGHENSASTPKTMGGKFRIVRAEDSGANLLPQPPGAPRATQPVPPIERRVQMKREALGFSLSSRERPMAGTASRYPSCAPKPPLGATMGHGLFATPGMRHEEYFYPSAPLNPVIDERQPTSSASGSAKASPRGGGPGAVVNKNPELKQKLFPR